MTTATGKGLVAAGISPVAAKILGTSIETGIVAAGSAIGNATRLKAKVNVVATTPASSGVQLPVVSEGEVVMVRNAGANSLAVYPSGATQKINGGADGAALAIAANKTGYFQRISGIDTLATVGQAS